MPCLIALFALISPRFAIAMLWLFTDKTTIAFESGWVGLMGFLLLPWTALAWTVCYSPLVGVHGFGWFIVILGFVADLSTWFGSANRRQTY